MLSPPELARSPGRVPGILAPLPHKVAICAFTCCGDADQRRIDGGQVIRIGRAGDIGVARRVRRHRTQGHEKQLAERSDEGQVHPA